MRVRPRDAGELLREPRGGRVREDDEPGLLGQVQAPDPLEDFPRDDPPAPGGGPGLRHPDPDPHQVAVRLAHMGGWVGGRAGGQQAAGMLTHQRTASREHFISGQKSASWHVPAREQRAFLRIVSKGVL